MDQIKIGEFISKLRREQNLTQEQLGEKLRVTNKTISRWETGNYMPDIEMLQVLSNMFEVGINEILAGERLSDQDYKKVAEKNIIEVAKKSAFTIDEKRKFFKKKWLKEHVALIIISILISIGSIVLPIIFGYDKLLVLSPFIAVGVNVYLKNRLMAYIEARIYD